MIVRPTSGSLLLITQPDHAALAGRIMTHSSDLSRSPRRARILYAIAEHDNGWHEPDSLPIINSETGRVVDFVAAPAALKQGVWPRALARLAHDPWSAALVAQHAIAVYDRYRSDAGWTNFFSQMELSRNALVRQTTLSLDDLLSDYVFVRLGDLISLTFCAGWTDEQTFGRWSLMLRGPRVTVSGDPFDGREIAIEVAAREIPDKRFASENEFRATLAAAPTVVVRGQVSGE